MAKNTKSEVHFADPDIAKIVVTEEKMSVVALKTYIAHEKDCIYNYETKVKSILQDIENIPKKYAESDREDIIIQTTCTLTLLEKCLQNKRECVAILDRLVEFKKRMIESINITTY